MYAFVKWQPSEFVVTSEKECRQRRHCRHGSRSKKTTQIAMFARTFIRGGFFFIFIRFTATRCILTLLLFFFHCWLFYVCATISTVRPTFSPGDTQTHTHTSKSERASCNFILCHITSCLFIWLFVSVFHDWLDYLKHTHTHTPG